MEYEINLQGDVFTVEITSFYAGCPAKTWGAPESCYPGDPAEIEYDVLSVEVEDEDGEITTLEGDAAENYARQYGEELDDAVMHAHQSAIRESQHEYD